MGCDAMPWQMTWWYVFNSGEWWPRLLWGAQRPVWRAKEWPPWLVGALYMLWFLSGITTLKTWIRYGKKNKGSTEQAFFTCNICECDLKSVVSGKEGKSGAGEKGAGHAEDYVYYSIALARLPWGPTASLAHRAGLLAPVSQAREVYWSCTTLQLQLLTPFWHAKMFNCAIALLLILHLYGWLATVLCLPARCMIIFLFSLPNLIN